MLIYDIQYSSQVEAKGFLYLNLEPKANVYYLLENF